MHIELLSDDIAELQDLVGHILRTYLLIAQHLQGCSLILRQLVEIFLGECQGGALLHSADAFPLSNLLL